MADFDTLEVSVDSGRPVSYFIFSLGSNVWRYTTAEVEITVDGERYLPASIQGDSIKQTGESINDALTLDAPSFIAPAQMFMSAPPTRPIRVQIGFSHVGVEDDEMIIAYTGEILQINFHMPGRARITCEALMSSMSREGLRLAWQRTCPYALYDPVTCKVNKASYQTNFYVLSINGLEIGVDSEGSQASGYFNNGFIEWTHPVRGVEYIAIDTHRKVTAAAGEPDCFFTLFSPPGDLFEGASGKAHPACDFTPTACQDFGNYDNYGGVPDLPGRSPFDGNPVW